jgi:hypothetical protein
MYRASYDTFAIVVSFIHNSWELTHVTTKIFEMQAMAN